MNAIKLFALCCLCLLWPLGALADSLTTDQILEKLEARYRTSGISVSFHQTSTLSALDVSDTAEGRIYIKPPGRMRWEYDAPEKQSIVTDGKTVWIYRPEDNQVMTGEAATFFGEGGGGLFLSDMASARKHFAVTRLPAPAADVYLLQMTPAQGETNIEGALVTVSARTFEIEKVATKNPYGDETVLTFEKGSFDETLSDSLFSFTPPKGTEVLTLGQ